MATLRDIKRRIGSIVSIQKITQAMKMVSTAKLRKAQTKVENARPYFKKLESSISTILSSLEGEFTHPLTSAKQEIKKIALIVISSDRGMCGSFNTHLLRDVSHLIENKYKIEYPNAEIQIIPIGKKALNYFSKTNFAIIDQYTNINDNTDFSTIKSIIDKIKFGFLNNQFDLVFVHNMEFVNIIKQLPFSYQLLPFVASNIAKPTGKSFNLNFIFEPDKKAILNDLIPKLIDTKLWSSVLNSIAAEHAARRVAMDNATSNATDLIKNLNLVYNKVRQASITKEIIEIVSGANALKGNR